jgi:hypothetical protein
MKILLNIKILGLAFILTTLLVLDQSQYSDVYGQLNNKQFDMILLSHQYNSIGFNDEIVGEILNNGTDTAKSVEISAIFYNDSGVIGHESSGTDPTTINSGGKSVFTLPLVDPVIRSDAESYDFTLKWQDEQLVNYFLRFTGGDIAVDDGGGDDGGGDDGGGDDGGGDDGGGDDGGGDDGGGDDGGGDEE